MNLLTPLAIRIGRLSRLPRYLPQIVAVDKTIHRLSGGRIGLLTIAGLPQLFLTVRGRRSGVLRTMPLLCVPHQGSLLVAGSNWCAPKLPAWVFQPPGEPRRGGGPPRPAGAGPRPGGHR